VQGVRTDVLEPLAIMDTNYPPSLELTDIFDDSETLTAVPFDDVLPSSSMGATTALCDTTTATNSATTSVPPLATTTLALTDQKK